MNFFGIILVLFISVLVSGEVKNQSEVLYLSLWFGISFGIVLQRSRFCFYCLSRDFIEKSNAEGLLGIITSLVVGTLGYHIIFGAFLTVSLLRPIILLLQPMISGLRPMTLILMFASLILLMLTPQEGEVFYIQVILFLNKNKYHSGIAKE